ncbi:hypothetical protein [Zooshikella ganghwensis]|uniref:Uncharacterized protein n=1 Tax=Zooshikella ganghwensis TaxID=202772 RepID=A0A4P9VLY8_9GAMM|nr:hypothetical protein [Zooshikella ganghwensis]RDH44395.1 hypothetical protein B9G39_13640 [Zooshikella ganghwensis]
MQLDQTYKNVVVNDLHVKRVGNEFNATLSFHSRNTQNTVELLGIQDIESLGEILCAHTLWLEKPASGTLDYGTYIISALHNYLTQIAFDSLS